ncbi:MAG: hypothetical protein CMG74_04670 [Candidatus Marinimicrobia bacterium]|nr:hypothetical protein [Candidatus Neomarinimicrobiota bacterium]
MIFIYYILLILIFFLIFLIFSFLFSVLGFKNYKKNIIVSAFVENFVLFYYGLKVLNLQLDIIFLLCIISISVKYIYLIYVPLLIERSFSLMILISIYKKKFKNIDHLKKYIKNKYPKIIKLRIDFFKNKKVILNKSKKVEINKLSFFFLKFFLFLKKIYKIKNNNIL